jgi:hypothetical protein
VVSIAGFIVTLSNTLDFYLLGDDLFVFSTGMSLFYSWQTYEETTLGAVQALVDFMMIPSTLRKMADEKIRLSKE